MSLWEHLTDKDRSIIIQVIYKETINAFGDSKFDTLLALDVNNRDGWRREFEDLLAHQFGAVKALLDSVESFDEARAASSTVQQAFPGAVDVTQQQPTYTQAQQYTPPPPQGNVVQFPQQQQPLTLAGPAPQQFQPPQQGFQAPGAAPAGGGGKSDALFADLINNPQQWIDVRSQKRGDSSPDFEHAFQMGQNGRKTAVWLNGKFGPAPQWVFQQLQAQGRL